MARRWSLAIVGAVLFVVGGVWFFQGIGAMGGSAMSGHPLWGWVGAGCAVVGAAVFVIGLRAARA